MALINSITTFDPNTPIASDDHNTDHQAFMNGVNNLDARVILLESGNTTISGNKTLSGSVTFSSLPTCSGVPASGSQLVNKTYADALITGLDFGDISGTLGISAGGTGQVTANAALNALLPSQAANASKFLKTDGTNTSWSTVSKSDVGLSAVENTALSTFTGTGNITTVGTLSAGSIPLSLTTGSTSNITEGSNLYFTDERAQDAVGAILLDSTTIDFTYSDATPSITASVIWPSGNTASRPSVTTGYMYFDTTLGKPIWKSGSDWVDATGATV